MRKFEDVYKEYCDWLVAKTKNDLYVYETFLASFEDEKTAKSFLFRNILDLCYDPKDGLFYFCKFIIGDLTEIGYPKPFRYNSLLRKWDKLIKSHKHISLLCHRGSGKSVFFSEILNLYDMFLFKYRRIILISSSSEQAEHILDEIKKIVDNNEWLSTKKLNGKWAMDNIEYNGGYIMAKGIGSEILGQHVDRIVVDDILRTDNKLSDNEIEDYIDMNLEPMLLNRDGQMIVVGTPKTSTDIFTVIDKRVKEGSNWKAFRFPAIIDYANKIIQCPDRFTWEDIMSKRLSMGSQKFAREYQLEFFSRDTSLFPERIIKPAREKGESCVLLEKADSRGVEWSYVGAVDVARSGSVSADSTVVIVLAFNSITQTKQIVHFWREKGLKISEQAYYIANIAKKFNNCYMLVEQNNMGQDMIDELVDSYNVNVGNFVTGGKGQKKDELIRFLVSSFEHEQFVIPQGDEYSKEQMSILEDELTKFCAMRTPFGNETFKGVGAHDDTVMSLALANRATQEFGVPFALSNFGGQSSNPYNSLMPTHSVESDLVNQIKMGIYK